MGFTWQTYGLLPPKEGAISKSSFQEDICSLLSHAPKQRGSHFQLVQKSPETHGGGMNRSPPGVHYQRKIYLELNVKACIWKVTTQQHECRAEICGKEGLSLTLSKVDRSQHLPPTLNLKKKNTKECVSKFYLWKFISGMMEVRSQSSTVFYPTEKMYSSTHQLLMDYLLGWTVGIEK